MSITLLLSADLYQGSPVANITLDGVVQRSEERRVGKECW